MGNKNDKGEWISKYEICDLSKNYLEHVFYSGNHVTEAFSLEITRDDIEFMLDLSENGAEIVALIGKHIEADGGAHTFTFIALDSDGQLKPHPTNNRAGVQRWKPKKSVRAVLGDASVGEISERVKTHLNTMGFGV